MKKSGQLTIFIILAIVIIAAVFLFFAIQTDFIKQPSNPDAERIRNFVQSCIEQEGEKTIYQIGQNGGYYFPTNLSTDSGVAIYYQNGKTYVPTREQIENEISKSIILNLPDCINNFTNFADLQVDYGKSSVETDIQDEKINLNVNYPLRVIKEDSVIALEDFKIEISLRVGKIHNAVLEFVQQSDENVCLSCIYDISEKDDLNVEIIDDYGNNTIIFVFRDETITSEGGFFELVFANKYG